MISTLLFRMSVDFIDFTGDLQSSASPLRHEASQAVMLAVASV